MKFEVKWCTEEENQDSHYWCDGCDRFVQETFKVALFRLKLILCFDCMKTLQAAVSPLSVLVTTGKDTKY